MTKTPLEQKVRHLALDVQWKASSDLKNDALRLQNAIRAYGEIDPKTENSIRHAEQTIAQIRKDHPNG